VVDDESKFGARANAKILMNTCLVTGQYNDKPTIWLSGGIENKMGDTTEIIGLEVETKKVHNSLCYIPNRQYHIMAPLKDYRMLIGFGYFEKHTLNDL